MSGFPNKSVEADEALWSLSETARSQEDVKSIILHRNTLDALQSLEVSQTTRDWYDRFRNWLDSYGHRVFDLDILHETMQDNPSIALHVVRAYIENPTASPMLRQKQKAEMRRIAEGDFQKWLANKPLMRRLLQGFLTLTQKYAAMRESRPFFLHLGWPLMRQDILELGRRLVNHHVLPSVDDVFFLIAGELQYWATQLDANKLDGPRDEYTKVNERRQEWEWQKSLTPPDHINQNLFVRFLLRCFSPRLPDGRESSRALSGIPASPGKAKGSICIVKSQQDFGKFRHGQILIAPYTTPAWTPLLSLAAGVVTETGGALSHAAIIAREYGVPAVVGVTNVLAQVRDGEDIEIDGNTGHVYVARTQQEMTG